MERLTKKYNIIEFKKYAISDWEAVNELYMAYSKLSKLEDLEDELRIPLEVLFKALKDGFWCKVQEDIEKFDACEIVFRFDVKKLLVWICCDYLSFRLEDYGKTWWLEEPKEEVKNDI